MMFRYHQWIAKIILFITLSFSSAILAQEVCSALVQAAFEQVNASCDATGRNEVCYGNLLINAEPHAAVETFTFEQVGDVESVTALGTLQLSTMSLTDETWGVALMRIQANLPDTVPGQNVTMLLFGEVNIENNVESVVEVPMTATGNVNVRLRPTSNANNVMASLSSGQEVIATGRLSDNSWVRIKVEGDTRGAGWVSSQFLNGEIDSLIVIEPEAPQFGPMQAFSVQTGIRDRMCDDVPDSGVLVQTPEGVRQIQINANGVEILLGSTAYLQTGDGYLYITLVEGQARVTAVGVTQAVPAGTYTRVPLDENGVANGAPEFPQPYDYESLLALPVSIALPQQVTVADALTTDEIEAAVADAETAASSDVLVDGVYNQNWSNGIFNTAQIIVLDGGAAISWQVLGGNPTPTIMTRIAPGVYQASFVTLTVTSPTSYTITSTEGVSASGVLAG